MPADLGDEREIARNRRTLLLLLGGAASLLLPLLGVAYLRMTDKSAGSGGPAAVVFQKRAGSESAQLVMPASVPAPKPMEPAEAPAGPVGSAARPSGGGSSLSFVRGGDELYPEKPAAAPPPAPRPPPPVVQAPPPEPAAPPAKKTFTMPKLKPTKSFSSFNRGGGGQAAAPAGAQAPKSEAEMRKMIEARSRGAQAPTQPAVPAVQGQQDANALLQNLQNKR